MGQLQRRGVEGVAGDKRGGGAVQIVAADGGAEIGHMDPDLVSASRDGGDVNLGVSAVGRDLKHTIMGDSLLRAGGSHGAGLADDNTFGRAAKGL